MTDANFTQLGERIEKINLANGWDRPYEMARQAREGHLDPRQSVVVEHQIAMLSLIASEVYEAIEELRNGKGLEAYVSHPPVPASLAAEHSNGIDAIATWVASQPGKPEGVPSELADVLIRVVDFCNAWKIDLGEAVDGKLAYNETRSYRHGGKTV